MADRIEAKKLASDWHPRADVHTEGRRAPFQNNGLAAIRSSRRSVPGKRSLSVRASRPARLPAFPVMTWAERAADGVDRRWMDGIPAQMLVPPYINQLAVYLHEFLDKPPSGTRNPR